MKKVSRFVVASAVAILVMATSAPAFAAPPDHANGKAVGIEKNTPTAAPATITSDGNGANVPGPYDPSNVGAPSGNGNGNGRAVGKPAAGTVGNADDKNPPGQLPDAASDGNNGYECDSNNGVGQGNPAHSSCDITASWSANVGAKAECNTEGPGVVVTGFLRNTEPAGHPELDMTVSAAFQGVAMTPETDVATSGGGQADFSLLLADQTDLLPGVIDFSTTWPKDDQIHTFHATTNQVDGCEDVVPPKEPVASWTILGPNCGDTTYPVTVYADKDNEGPITIRIRVNENAEWANPMMPDVVPGRSYKVDLPIAPGETQELGLYIVNDDVDNPMAVDTIKVTAPAALGSPECPTDKSDSPHGEPPTPVSTNPTLPKTGGELTLALYGFGAVFTGLFCVAGWFRRIVFFPFRMMASSLLFVNRMV